MINSGENREEKVSKPNNKNWMLKVHFRFTQPMKTDVEISVGVAKQIDI